ncbi:MAG: Spy/CpxP family protein refolding chaperone [Bdellovibrionales bacterium]|nr:Spy/CpxP family protein refolding chaperone [Bdellovibrionales bacterium]
MKTPYHAFRKLGFVVLGIATLGIAPLAFSGCRHHRSPEHRAEWVVKKIKGELDLTEVQVAKLNSIKDEFLAERKAHDSKRRLAMDEFLKQVRSDKMDTAKIQGLIDERRTHMDQVGPKIVARIAEFHAMLTPEQRNKAADKLQKFADRFND